MIGDLRLFKPLDEVRDQLKGLLVCSSCVLVAKTQNGSSEDVDITESYRSKIEALSTNLLRILLLCSRDVVLVNAFNDRGKL